MGVVQVAGIFEISVPLICTGVPTSPSAHAKVTLAVVSRAMSLCFEDTVPRREQFLSRPVELESKYKAPPPPSAVFPEKMQFDKLAVPVTPIAPPTSEPEFPFCSVTFDITNATVFAPPTSAPPTLKKLSFPPASKTAPLPTMVMAVCAVSMWIREPR
jgi:hypothetical protein